MVVTFSLHMENLFHTLYSRQRLWNDFRAENAGKLGFDTDLN